MRLNAVVREPLVLVGYKLKRDDLRGVLVPLTVSRRPPSAYLRVNLTLEMDDANAYLAVAKSSFAVYADEDGRHMLCHYDYERQPTHDYPDPHFQVEGTSVALEMIAQKRPDLVPSSLREIHFPVGGRRFRPTLEDVIEMLIAERIADPRDRWDSVVERHRDEWREAQLRAAVRRWHEVAADCLREHGYYVEPPAPDRK